MEKVLDNPDDNDRDKLMEFARSYLANRETKISNKSLTTGEANEDT